MTPLVECPNTYHVGPREKTELRRCAICGVHGCATCIKSFKGVQICTVCAEYGTP